MGKIRGLSRAFVGKNSIFVRIFTGLILLSLIMISFMGFWMNNISSQNYRRQVAMSNLDRLKQADEAMTLMVNMLNQSMSQMMWSSDFITYMVSPRRVTPEQDYRIIRQLKNTIDGSELVEKAFLYSPLTKEIYDSSAIYSAEEFEDWSILNEYLQEDHSNKERNGAMTRTTVMTNSGRIMVIQDLNIASRIGILIYELNGQELSDILGLKSTSEESEVFVYDKNRVGAFEGLISYETIRPEWADQEAFIQFENESDRAGGQTEGFYRYDSPAAGWIYLMPLDTQGLQMRVRDILPMYILVALVFLMISIVFDLYISRSIYQPINRLMKMVTQIDGRKKATGDAEIDFLEGAYSDAFGQQSQLRGLIAGIAPEILDSMFKNLLVGKALGEQRVAEILEGVGNPVLVNGRFLVIVCQMNEPRERTVTDAELNLHLVSIRKLIMGAETDDYQMFDIRTEKMIVAIVMGFDSEYPVVGMKREYAKISQQLQKLGEKIPYKLQVERGSIYQNILDIRYAYKEAMDKLLYQHYMESSDVENKNGHDLDTNQIVNLRYIKERTKSLVGQARQGNKEATETIIIQILADLKQDERELEDFRKLVGVFLDGLTEKVIALPLNKEDQRLLESTHAVTELAHLKTQEDLTDYVLKYVRVAAGLLHVYSRKNSYQYVMQAKEYIAQNYADSSLSLNDICEHIGISASYLSELFNENGGEKFSGYLANFRVEKACQLLRTTNVNIKEIGFCCGFNSIQNFIRVFKKYMDQTPGHYRETQGKQIPE